MNLCCCVLSWQVSQSDKCHMKKCFFCENTAVSHMTFQAAWPVCWVRSIDMIICLASWLSFHPFFIQFSPCCILLLSSTVLFIVVCVCSCLLSGLSLFGFCLSCVLCYWYCSGQSSWNVTLDCSWCVPRWHPMNWFVCLHVLWLGSICLCLLLMMLV